MSTYFSPPPQDAGLAQLRTYLFCMSEQLNAALQSLSASEPAAAVSPAASSSASLSAPDLKELSNQQQTLRALVVKSAETVRQEMNNLSARLSSSYLALSQWGAYQRNLESSLMASAEDMIASYGYEETLKALSKDVAAFESYRVSTGQYIKTGLLYYDDEGVPRYGVAVGEKLTCVEVDGENVLTRADLCATFTSDRLTFWQGGVEVAHISNSRLSISNAEITRSLRLGDWEIANDKGLTVRYTG